LVRDNRFGIAVMVCLVVMATSSWPWTIVALATVPCVLAHDHRRRARPSGATDPTRIFVASLRSSPTLVFAGIGAALLLSGLLAFAQGPPTARGVMLLAQFGTIPATAVMFWLAPRSNDLASAVWRGVTAGAFAAGLGAVVQVVFGADRAQGLGDNAIVFGNVALMMGALSVSLLPALDADLKWSRPIGGAAGGLGLLASFLSGSRGGWLAVPLFAVLLAVQFRRYLGHRQWIRWSGLATAVAAFVAWFAHGVLRERVGEAVTEIAHYVGAAPRDPAAGTSIGARFEVWRSALDAFRQRPVTGVGWGNLARFFDVQAYAGHRNPRIATFEHAHHQFLGSLASAGIIGAATFVAVLAVPAMWFWHAAGGKTDRECALGTSGLIVVGGFAITGLTEAMFESFVPIAFYSVVVAAIATQLPADTMSRPATPTLDHDDPSVLPPWTLAVHRGGASILARAGRHARRTARDVGGVGGVRTPM
jgi:O-antigen ligase